MEAVGQTKLYSSIYNIYLCTEGGIRVPVRIYVHIFGVCVISRDIYCLRNVKYWQAK
jgi:hypothetical protein